MTIPLPTVSTKTERECGSCSVCCEILAVPELSKGNHSRCRHQETAGVSLAGGCRVYPDRPPTCRSFECLWLGDPKWVPGDERRRPDRLGLMLATSTIRETGREVLTAWEVYAGAAAEQQYFLDKLAKKTPVMVVTAPGAKTLDGKPVERYAFMWPRGPMVNFTFFEDGYTDPPKPAGSYLGVLGGPAGR